MEPHDWLTLSFSILSALITVGIIVWKMGRDSGRVGEQLADLTQRLSEIANGQCPIGVKHETQINTIVTAVAAHGELLSARGEQFARIEGRLDVLEERVRQHDEQLRAVLLENQAT